MNKPIASFNAEAKVENCVVLFRDRRGKQIRFYSFESPLIHLSTETTSDSLFINSTERFEELWDALDNLFNKWVDEDGQQQGEKTQKCGA